ncbi:MAG: VWA domain-containing protein [Vicinamibacterales bacterium]
MRPRTVRTARQLIGLFALTGATLLATPPVQAQRPSRTQTQTRPVPPQRPVFRTDVELIQVEVVAVDALGRPVRGLTAGDFALLDDGEPRDVAIFEEFTRQPSDGVPALPPAFPRDVADNRAPGADRLIVLAIDDMVPGDRYDRLEALGHEVVERVGDRAAMSLLFTSGAPRVEATMDHAQLLRAIDRISERTSAAPRVARVVRNETGQCATALLTQLSQALRADDRRRKSVIYISPYCGSGLDLETLDTGVEGARDLSRMLESLRQANVAFYGIDPRGPVGFSLGNFPPPDLTVRPAGDAGDLILRPHTRSWDPVLSSQRAMRQVADATGGFAITDTADFSGGIARVVADFDHYYVLGFYPGHPDDHDFRRLTVRASRPDLTLRYRRGFQAGDGQPVPRNTNPMAVLSEGVLPRADLPLRLAATPLPNGAREVPVALSLEITMPDDVPPALADDVDLFVMAVDLDRAKVARSIARVRHVDLAGADGAARTYQVISAIDLRPGRYQLRVSARSAAVGRAGSVYMNVDVPDASRVPVGIGGLVLGYEDPDRLTADAVSLEAGALPFAPLLERALPSIETLRVFVPVWRRDADGPMPAAVELVDARDQVVRLVEAVQPPGERIGAFDVRLSLIGVPSGPYRLRARAGAGEAVASREVGLYVMSGAVRFLAGEER